MLKIPTNPIGRPSRILVVDDQEINRKLMEALLTPLGYDVIQASNGKEALEKFDLHQPDLIILDLHLPFISAPHHRSCSAEKTGY